MAIFRDQALQRSNAVYNDICHIAGPTEPLHTYLRVVQQLSYTMGILKDLQPDLVPLSCICSPQAFCREIQAISCPIICLLKLTAGRQNSCHRAQLGKQSTERGPCLVRNQGLSLYWAGLSSAYSHTPVGFRSLESPLYCCPLHGGSRYLFLQGFLFNLQIPGGTLQIRPLILWVSLHPQTFIILFASVPLPLGPLVSSRKKEPVSQSPVHPPGPRTAPDSNLYSTDTSEYITQLSS